MLWHILRSSKSMASTKYATWEKHGRPSGIFASESYKAKIPDHDLHLEKMPFPRQGNEQ